MLEELKQLDALIWVALTTGGTDIDADFAARSPAEFRQISQSPPRIHCHLCLPHEIFFLLFHRGNLRNLWIRTYQPSACSIFSQNLPLRLTRSLKAGTLCVNLQPFLNICCLKFL